MSGRIRNRIAGDQWRRERSDKRFESGTVRNRRKDRLTIKPEYPVRTGTETVHGMRVMRQGQRPL